MNFVIISTTLPLLSLRAQRGNLKWYGVTKNTTLHHYGGRGKKAGSKDLCELRTKTPLFTPSGPNRCAKSRPRTFGRRRVPLEGRVVGPSRGNLRLPKFRFLKVFLKGFRTFFGLPHAETSRIDRSLRAEFKNTVVTKFLTFFKVSKIIIDQIYSKG